MQSLILTALCSVGRRFKSAADGSILPTFTLALVPIMGMVGTAVDYSRASNLRTGLQAAIDVATIAGARDGTTNWNDVARNMFDANLQAKGSSVFMPTFTRNDDGSYSGSVGASVATVFLGVIGTSAIPVSVQSRVVVSGTRPGQFCLLALNSSAQPAVQLTGNAAIDVNAPQCIFQVNSNSASAVTLNGNTSLSSTDNCFVGSVVKVGNATLSPPPDFMCKPVPVHSPTTRSRVSGLATMSITAHQDRRALRCSRASIAAECSSPAKSR